MVNNSEPEIQGPQLKLLETELEEITRTPGTTPDNEPHGELQVGPTEDLGALHPDEAEHYFIGEESFGEASAEQDPMLRALEADEGPVPGKDRFYSTDEFFEDRSLEVEHLTAALKVAQDREEGLRSEVQQLRASLSHALEGQRLLREEAESANESPLADREFEEEEELKQEVLRLMEALAVAEEEKKRWQREALIGKAIVGHLAEATEMEQHWKSQAEVTSQSLERAVTSERLWREEAEAKEARMMELQQASETELNKASEAATEELRQQILDATSENDSLLQKVQLAEESARRWQSEADAAQLTLQAAEKVFETERTELLAQVELATTGLAEVQKIHEALQASSKSLQELHANADEKEALALEQDREVHGHLLQQVESLGAALAEATAAEEKQREEVKALKCSLASATELAHSWEMEAVASKATAAEAAEELQQQAETQQSLTKELAQANTQVEEAAAAHRLSLEEIQHLRLQVDDAEHRLQQLQALLQSSQEAETAALESSSQARLHFTQQVRAAEQNALSAEEAAAAAEEKVRHLEAQLNSCRAAATPENLPEKSPEPSLSPTKARMEALGREADQALDDALAALAVERRKGESLQAQLEQSIAEAVSARADEQKARAALELHRESNFQASLASMAQLEAELFRQRRRAEEAETWVRSSRDEAAAAHRATAAAEAALSRAREEADAARRRADDALRAAETAVSDADVAKKSMRALQSTLMQLQEGASLAAAEERRRAEAFGQRATAAEDRVRQLQHEVEDAKALTEQVKRKAAEELQVVNAAAADRVREAVERAASKAKEAEAVLRQVAATRDASIREVNAGNATSRQKLEEELTRALREVEVHRLRVQNAELMTQTLRQELDVARASARDATAAWTTAQTAEREAHEALQQVREELLLARQATSSARTEIEAARSQVQEELRQARAEAAAARTQAAAIRAQAATQAPGRALPSEPGAVQVDHAAPLLLPIEGKRGLPPSRLFADVGGAAGEALSHTLPYGNFAFGATSNEVTLPRRSHLNEPPLDHSYRPRAVVSPPSPDLAELSEPSSPELTLHRAGPRGHAGGFLSAPSRFARSPQGPTDPLAQQARLTPWSAASPPVHSRQGGKGHSLAADLRWYFAAKG